jgi:hypothetical protein
MAGAHLETDKRQGQPGDQCRREGGQQTFGRVGS